MKKTKLSPKLDMRPAMKKKMEAYELRVIQQSIVASFPEDDFDGGELKAGYEKLKTFSFDVYTVRYRGQIILRRFSDDMLCTRYHYEAPVFNNVKEYEARQ